MSYTAYRPPAGLHGFFLFDAVKAAAGAVVGAVKGVVSSVTGVASQTGSTTPVYIQAPAVAPAPNYTPYLLAGGAVLAVILLTGRKRGG